MQIHEMENKTIGESQWKMNLEKTTTHKMEELEQEQRKRKKAI